MLKALVSTSVAMALALAPPPSSGPLPNEALILRADGCLLGFDAQALLNSSLYVQMSRGEFAGIEALAPPDKVASMRKEMQEGLAKGLKEAEDKTGVRLDRDVDRVVVAVGRLGEKEPLITVLALGRFDRAKVTGALQASYKAEGGASHTRDVGGVSLLLFDKAGKTDLGLAMPDEHTLLFGSPAPLEQALLDRQKGVNALAVNPALLDLVKGLKPDTHYWFVGGSALMDKVNERTAGGAPPSFPVPSNLALTGSFEGGLEIAAQMTDEVAAKRLTDLIQGGLAAGRAQAGQAGQARESAAIMSLLSSISVTQEGKAVRLASSASAAGSGGLGLVAAIAIPSLLRARTSANEAAAIGDIRTIISGQAAYSAMNKGGYGELRCLSEPKTCLPGYGGPSFLDPGLGTLADKSGYKRAFFAGRPMKAGSRALQSFAYTAVPTEPGRTGVRSFCGDNTGIVCADPGGAAIQPLGGSCPKTCSALH